MNQVKHIEGISGILSTPKKNVPYIADFVCEACINFATKFRAEYIDCSSRHRAHE